MKGIRQSYLCNGNSLAGKTYLQADSRFGSSKWETALQRYDIFHWLGANLQSALYLNWNSPQPSSISVSVSCCLFCCWSINWCFQCYFYCHHHCDHNHYIPFFVYIKRLIPQIPQCTCPMSHNALFCNRNMHMCAHFCYKMMHCGTFV